MLAPSLSAPTLQFAKVLILPVLQGHGPHVISLPLPHPTLTFPRSLSTHEDNPNGPFLSKGLSILICRSKGRGKHALHENKCVCHKMSVYVLPQVNCYISIYEISEAKAAYTLYPDISKKTRSCSFPR